MSLNEALAGEPASPLFDNRTAGRGWSQSTLPRVLLECNCGFKDTPSYKATGSTLPRSYHELIAASFFVSKLFAQLAAILLNQNETACGQGNVYCNLIGMQDFVHENTRQCRLWPDSPRCPIVKKGRGWFARLEFSCKSLESHIDPVCSFLRSDQESSKVSRCKD